MVDGLWIIFIHVDWSNDDMIVQNFLPSLYAILNQYCKINTDE